MCVIVAKECGKEMPSNTVLKQCWDRNPDGAGIMFNNEEDKVECHKGFMTFERLLSFIEYLENRIDVKNSSVVIHFRIGTSGKNDEPTCHPYPISNKDNQLRSLDYTTKVAMCHNGVLSNFVDRASQLNDTQIFIKSVLYPLKKINEDFVYNQEVDDLIFNLTNKERYNRFCFLYGNGDLIRIGDWKERDGIYYSNLNHVPNVTYSKFSGFYKKYDDFQPSLFDIDDEYSNDEFEYECNLFDEITNGCCEWIKQDVGDILCSDDSNKITVTDENTFLNYESGELVSLDYNIGIANIIGYVQI